MYSSNSKLDKAMTQEQFAQVVDAILAGKYSWACVLILRFAGYNPLHYIPYRTYNRLMKEHDSSRHRRKDDRSSSSQDRNHSSHPSHKIKDLNYLEPCEGNRTHVRGGNRAFVHLEICSLFKFFNRN